MGIENLGDIKIARGFTLRQIKDLLKAVEVHEEFLIAEWENTVSRKIESVDIGENDRHELEDTVKNLVAKIGKMEKTQKAFEKKSARLSRFSRQKKLCSVPIAREYF